MRSCLSRLAAITLLLITTIAGLLYLSTSDNDVLFLFIPLLIITIIMLNKLRRKESGQPEPETVTKPEPTIQTVPIAKPEHTHHEFLVVGNRDGKFKENLDYLINQHVNRFNNKPYSGNSRYELEELVQEYSRIYKYRINTKGTLQREPENRYDENAVAVYWKDKKIGYIRKVDRERVEPLLDNERVNLKIKAGPFAQEGYDDLEFIDEHRVTIQ